MTRKGWLWLALGGAILLAIWKRGDIMATVRLAFGGNFGGVREHKIDTIVLHTTEGTLESAIRWFQNPAAKVSAHFVVGRDGSVTRSVPDANVAWHAGDYPVNDRSVGIEMEGAAGDPDNFTPEMIDAVVSLCRSLVRQYGVPVTRAIPGIVGHVDIPSARARGKVDPGPHFPWDDFMARVAGNERIA